MSESEPVRDEAAKADKLINEATGKTPIATADLDDPTHFGKASSPAKVEVYARRLQLQTCGERDRLIEEKNDLLRECRYLRAADKELASLKKSLARDRWEMAISVVAMASGGGLISSGPSGSAPFVAGWTILGLAGVWQFGKTLWISVVDLFAKTVIPPASTPGGASVEPPAPESA